MLSLFMLSIALNSQLAEREDTADPALFTFSEKSLQYTALGYDHFMATWMWFQTSAYYGSHVEQTDYDYLAHLLNAIVQLNPKFEPVYYMAASVFPWGMGSTALSRPFVMQAMIEFPEDWRWAYYRGFNSYWFEHNDAQAAHFFEIAALKPNAPPLVSSLALRMRAQAGNIDTGLNFLKDLLQRKNDAKVQATLLQQYQTLLTEKQLQQLESLLKQLPARANNRSDLQRLQALGYALPEKLADGGQVLVLKDGSLLSSQAKKRFKLFVPAKRHKGGASEATR